MIRAGVRKLGRIPDGGGGRLDSRDSAIGVADRHKKVRTGRDLVYAAIDAPTAAFRCRDAGSAARIGRQILVISMLVTRCW